MVASKLATAVAVGATWILLSGCTSTATSERNNDPIDTSDTQPLGGRDETRHCAQFELGGVSTYSMQYLENSSTSPLTFDKVRLKDSSGVSIVKSGIIDVPEDETGMVSLAGFKPGFPPDRSPVSAAIEEMKTIPGAGVPGAQDSKFYGLVLELKTSPGDVATFKSVVVDYHDQTGKRYRWDTKMETIVLDSDRPGCDARATD